MKKIKLSNSKLYTLVDDADYIELSKYKWSISTYGYATREQKIDGKRKHLAMHRVLLNPPDKLQVDHKNRNKLDNRRSNLRLATKAQNMWNRPRLKNNTTGFTGVNFYKPYQKWRAVMRINGKSKTLGYFASPEDASKERERVAKLIHGEFYCGCG